MITKQQYEKIRAAWPVQKRDGKLLKPYQHWDRLNVRLRFFCKFVNEFEGLDVLEFGCNAGMYGYEIAKVANTYTGIDRSDRFINEANVTARFVKNGNADFECKDVKGWLRDRRKAAMNGDAVRPYNALFASFALYHLSDKEVKALKAQFLPNCKLVFIQTRTAKRKVFRRHNSYKFWAPERVAAWLEDAGFKCEIVWGTDKKFAEIIGRRDAD